eukprot:6767577-Prymnesium_polylepis.1
MELLVDCAIMDVDKYWTALRNMRSVSKAFHRVVNAKLDALLAELKSKADAARREFELVANSGYPNLEQAQQMLYGDAWHGWLRQLYIVRREDPVNYRAFASYKELLGLYFKNANTVFNLLKFTHILGFWIHRDELFAWRIEACIQCHGKHDYIECITGAMWMAPCHTHSKTCCPVADVSRLRKSKTDKQAYAILSARPRTEALTALLQTRLSSRRYWVLPIPGIPP